MKSFKQESDIIRFVFWCRSFSSRLKILSVNRDPFLTPCLSKFKTLTSLVWELSSSKLTGV